MVWLKAGVLVAALGWANPAAAGDGGCASVRSLIAPTVACADAPRGIVLAGSPDRAALLAALAEAGEARFVERFAVAVPRYALVETDGTVVDKSLDARLAEAGFVSRLPWLSEAATVAALHASITRSVTARAQELKLDAARTAQLVDGALAQQAGRLDPATLRAREAGTLPHELGHGWFIRAFWPEASTQGAGHYGGPAPDWMDETAAVLMEDAALADRRRDQFAAAYRGEDATAQARLVDLTAFLSGAHPALPVLALPPGSAGVTVLTGAEAAGLAAAAGGFYLQARLFADYILARSGNPAAFLTAARRFAAGGTTADWLRHDGSSLRVPTTLPALQRDWEAWLATRFPAAPAR